MTTYHANLRRTLLPSVLLCMLCASRLHADSATRTLPEAVAPADSFSVSISIEIDPGTTVVGLEDRPPVDWTGVSNITNNGTYDAANHKVKWGPFFGGSIPAQVGYTIAAPADASGANCFMGTASFNGFNHAVGGDACVQVALPGDVDGDDDVDLADFAIFMRCFAGAGGGEGCPTGADADLDDDGDVDLGDYAIFAARLTGPVT